MKKFKSRGFRFISVLLVSVLAVGALTVIPAASVSASGTGWSTHHDGTKTVCSELGIDGYEYYKWMVNHDGDLGNDIDNTVDYTGYYIGTKYVGYDHRNPKGDCSGAYGVRDSKGVAAMNCTGFVWHVLMKSALNSGKTLEWANSNIPTMGDSYNGKSTNRLMWVYNWLPAHKNVEYYYYSSAKYNSITGAANAAVKDGILEYGDVIFLSTTYDAHVGIYTGDGTTNQWWDSCGDSGKGNEWGDKIDMKYGTFKYLYVIKGGAKNLTLLNVQAVSSDSGISEGYSLKGIVFDVFKDEGCTEKFGSITTVTDDGFGAFGLESEEDYDGGSRGVPVENRDYWLRVSEGNEYYCAGENAMKFSASGFTHDSDGATCVISFAGDVDFTDSTGETHGAVKVVPYVLLSLETKSEKPQATENDERFSLGNAVYEISREAQDGDGRKLVGYVKTNEDGKSGAYIFSDAVISDFGGVEWTDGSMKVPYGYDRGDGNAVKFSYFGKEVLGSDGFALSDSEVTFDRIGSGGEYGLTVLTAESVKTGIPVYDGRVFGDVDGDGFICSLDAVKILRAAAGLDDFGYEQQYLADVNGDGIISTLDAVEILRYSADISDSDTLGTPVDEEVYSVLADAEGDFGSYLDVLERDDDREETPDTPK